jgi:hypothetical protein
VGVLASNSKVERAQQYKLMLQTLDCVTRLAHFGQLGVVIVCVRQGRVQDDVSYVWTSTVVVQISCSLLMMLLLPSFIQSIYHSFIQSINH